MENTKDMVVYINEEINATSIHYLRRLPSFKDNSPVIRPGVGEQISAQNRAHEAVKYKEEITQLLLPLNGRLMVKKLFFDQQITNKYLVSIGSYVYLQQLIQKHKELVPLETQQPREAPFLERLITALQDVLKGEKTSSETTPHTSDYSFIGSRFRRSYTPKERTSATERQEQQQRKRMSITQKQEKRDGEYQSLQQLKKQQKEENKAYNKKKKEEKQGKKVKNTTDSATHTGFRTYGDYTEQLTENAPYPDNLENYIATLLNYAEPLIIHMRHKEEIEPIQQLYILSKKRWGEIIALLPVPNDEQQQDIYDEIQISFQRVHIPEHIATFKAGESGSQRAQGVYKSLHKIKRLIHRYIQQQ